MSILRVFMFEFNIKARTKCDREQCLLNSKLWLEIRPNKAYWFRWRKLKHNDDIVYRCV